MKSPVLFETVIIRNCFGEIYKSLAVLFSLEFQVKILQIRKKCSRKFQQKLIWEISQFF